MPNAKDSLKSTQRKAHGVDSRARDSDGEIRRKSGNTLVGTLRQTYGENFAKGYRSDTKLSTILKDTRAKSLDDLLRNRSDGRMSDSSRAILDDATTTYRTALKRLANK